MHNKIYSRHTKVQIVLSSVLSSACGYHRMYVVSWLYLFKIAHVYNILGAIRRWPIFNRHGLCRYYGFVYDLLTYTLILRLFIKAITMVYQHTCQSAEYPLPQAYMIMYQLVVTASTIGYGDVTPKSAQQILFITYSIPILCTAFAIYLHSILLSYNQLFI